MAAIDLVDIVEGLHERFLLHDDFTTRQIMIGEPVSIAKPPLIYSAVERQVPTEAGNMMHHQIRIFSRVCIQFQDRNKSELEALRYATELPYLIQQDDRLNNRISSGRALVADVIAGFALIDGIWFRVVDLYTMIVFKRPRTA